MILYKTKIIEYLHSTDKKIEIESTDNHYPFNESQQISDISVDLRLGYKGYVLSEELSELNTLKQEPFEEYFVEKTIDANGYLLMPHQIIFCPTLEMVKINDRTLMGYICGRITFARMGISVVCDQVKVPFGYESVIGLQIKNNTNVPVRIYGRQKIAQIIFMTVTKASDPYTGVYGSSTLYNFPVIKDSEFFSYSDSERLNIQKNKPKKKYIIPQQIMKRYNFMKTYHYIKTSVWVAYITIFISSCIIPYMMNPEDYNIITLVILSVIMLILVGIDLIIGYIGYLNKKNSDERLQ